MTAARKIKRPNSRGFSLIELVIVVVIIGIIGAIAVPRMSRGAKGAADSALIANLAVLRNALDLYSTEHTGAFPKFADIEDALLTYSDDTSIAGNTSTTKVSPYLYGPYIRAIPKIPVGDNKGLNTFTSTAPTATAGLSGWYYNDTTGQVLANCKDANVDDAGTAYNTY